MKPLLYSILTTVAYQNHFERSEDSQDGIAVFTSSRHSHQVAVIDNGTTLFFYSPSNARLLRKKFPDYATEDCLKIVHPAHDITGHLHLLGCFFEAAATLPADSVGTVPAGTDLVALAKQRLGQQLYRTRLLEKWNNACAVTGLTDTRLLRASHAKPWAHATDAERLDPANGFPLAVHLDALFDAGLVSFSDTGAILLSPSLTPQTMTILGVTADLRLRIPLSPQQRHYLAYHREHIFITPDGTNCGSV